MKRHRIALHWQVALAGSALAAVLVAAMLLLTERLLVSHFEALAQAQADDVARTLSRSFLRALERRAAELAMLSRSVDLVHLDRPDALHDGLQRLTNAAPIYRAMAVADLRGKVLAATDAARLPQSVADWPVATLAVSGPWLTDSRMAPAPPDANPVFGIDVGVPLFDAVGRQRGLLLAELDLDWFRRLRDEVLARADNLTVLSVAVFSSDGRPLINDQPELNRLARNAFAARPPHSAAGRLRHGPDATRLLATQRELQPRNAVAGLNWQVLVVQDLDAALRPVQRLQRLVLLSGVALVLLFSGLVYWLARRVVQPYAGLLAAVNARFLHDDGAQATGLTRYLDAVSTQLERLPALASALPGGPPGALGATPPLRIGDMLALVAGDAARLQRLLDVLPIGVAVFDGDLRVLYWNRHCETLFGWPAADVLGRRPWESFAPEMSALQTAESIHRVNEQHETYAVTRNGTRRDGSPIQCGWTVSPERDAQGRLVRALALVQDLTEHVRAETSRAQDAADIRALARQLLEHEAQVTRRLAQTLHDRLGQTMSALRLAFDAIEARGGDPAAWRASPMGWLIDQAVRQVRDALVELRPPLLDQQGLHATLDNEVRGLWRNPNRVRIALTSNDAALAAHYPAEVEYAAFMVCREAMANALLHARPHHIGVHMGALAMSLTVEIKDDGGGFDPIKSPPAGHLGLVGMRERALAVGAVLTVKSLPGLGSCVHFEWRGPRAATPDAADTANTANTASPATPHSSPATPRAASASSPGIVREATP